MKNIKSINTKKFNPKNKSHRANLYQESFMKHNVESRIFTLQKETINLTNQTLAVALDPTITNLLNLAEAVGDVETCIEFVKLSIPKLKEASTNIKYSKLQNLYSRTEEKKGELVSEEMSTEDSKLEESLEQAKEELEDAKFKEALIKFGISFEKESPENKSFINFFKYIISYFK